MRPTTLQNGGAAGAIAAAGNGARSFTDSAEAASQAALSMDAAPLVSPDHATLSALTLADFSDSHAAFGSEPRGGSNGDVVHAASQTTEIAPHILANLLRVERSTMSPFVWSCGINLVLGEP